METPLTPVLALQYLQELSTDVRAGAVLDPSGAHLAGAPEAADGARRLVRACAGARAAEIRVAAGSAFLTVSAAHSLVVLAGAFALSDLVLHDMAAVLGLLTGRHDDAFPPIPAAEGRTGVVAGQGVAVRWAGPGEPLQPMSAQDPRFPAAARCGAALLRRLEAE